MLKKIGTDDMRKKMGEILDCVNLRGDEYIIERKEKPISALVPIPKLAALTQVAKDYVLDMITPGPSTEPSKGIDVLVNKAKHESRKGGSCATSYRRKSSRKS